MPKLRKYVLAALLTAAACATLAQTPAPQRVDTVYDTVYRVDTVAQTAANDKYYDLAEKALNHRMTTITIILTLIGFLFVSLSILLVVEARRISSKIDHELELARKDVAIATLTAKNEALQARHTIECDLDELKAATKTELDKVRNETDISVNDIRRLKEEAQQHILDTKEQAKKDLEEIAETKKRAAQHAADLETQFAELARMAEKVAAPAMIKPTKAGIRLKARLKQIESADAREAVDKYELLLKDVESTGIGVDRIPYSIHKNIGSAYMALGKWPEAIKELQQYLDVQPLDGHALYLLAASFIKLYYATQDKGHLEGVLKAGSRTIELAPHSSHPYATARYNVACALALLEKKQEMFASLKEAIACDRVYKKMAREDEDLKAYWDDADFRALTKEDGGEQTG